MSLKFLLILVLTYAVTFSALVTQTYLLANSSTLLLYLLYTFSFVKATETQSRKRIVFAVFAFTGLFWMFGDVTTRYSYYDTVRDYVDSLRGQERESHYVPANLPPDLAREQFAVVSQRGKSFRTAFGNLRSLIPATIVFFVVAFAYRERSGASTRKGPAGDHRTARLPTPDEDSG